MYLIQVYSNKQQMRERKALKLNSNVKVIDLTGKEKKTFGSYDEMTRRHTKPDEKGNYYIITMNN